MLDEIILYHQEVMSTVDRSFTRYLMTNIDWQDNAICIYGARGVGKTTLLCQYLLDTYQTAERALYISADNIHVAAKGLLSIATEYFTLGGEALFIDEIHKYPNWEVELKNILDIYRTRKIVISGSSTIALQTAKADLSRRVVYYHLAGLSFREYLTFNKVLDVEAVSLEQVLNEHVQLAELFQKIPVLKHFYDYLAYGYYPYFKLNRDTYYLKLNNVIEKVLLEDIAVMRGIKPPTITVLKKMLQLVSTSTSLIPNIDKISKQLGVTRDVIYNSFEYLDKSGLIHNLFAQAQGLKLIRKPGKIFMDNTNLLYALINRVKLEQEMGAVRETFFVNQILLQHTVTLPDKGDFFVDESCLFEVGGKRKGDHQIKSEHQAYLALDGLLVGFKNRIPLYLFGCLY